MELFTGMKVSLKVWFLLFVAVIVFVGAARYESLKREVKQNTVTIATQKVEIKAKDQTIQTDQAVKQVDEAVQLHVDQVEKAVVKAHETIQQKLKEKEDVIRLRGQTATPTIDDVVHETQQLSEARIGALWEGFCAAEPTAAQCQPTQG